MTFSQQENLVLLCLNNSFMMTEEEDINGYILLKKQKMRLKSSIPTEDVLYFLKIYSETEFNTYKVVSLFQKNDDEVMFNLFDMVLNTLENGDFILGVAKNTQDHYVYKKLGFMRLNERTYGYQHVL
jgi:hypothetical protein